MIMINEIFFVKNVFQAFQVYDYKGRFIWLYFYSLNVIGSQFMLNLVCGVLSGYVFYFFFLLFTTF